MAGIDHTAAPAARARTILHVDLDAFYASVEVRERPELAGRPVIVGADPRGGRGRGVVTAASYEARVFGVHSAMPISHAWRRCPQGVYLRPRMGLYAQVSKRFMAILGRYTDLVEPLSIDEAFLDVTASRALFGEGAVIARRIKDEVRAEERITASIGVAPCKFVAKVASDLRKPDGLVVVGDHEVRDFLAPLPISALSSDESFDDSLIRDLERLGLNTLGALAALPVDAMADRFGKPGLRARFLAEGGAEPLRPSAPVEPLEESMELPDSRDGSQLPHALELLIDRFLALPDRRGRALRSLALSASLAGGGSWRIELALNQPSGSAEVLRLALAPKLEALPGPADSLTLRALEITAGDAEQTPLLSRLEEQRRGRLTEAVRQTRATAGADSLLRVLMLDPEARLPERRLTLSPFEAKRR